MRAVLQRVSHASVEVDGRKIAEISEGLLILLGVAIDDTDADIDVLVGKTINLRIFEDDQGKMNLSLLDRDLAVLVVSQFTLLADVRRGRRPSFTHAALPANAERLYEKFISATRTRVRNVQCGKFGAMMNVKLLNSGPVTILLDSKELI